MNNVLFMHFVFSRSSHTNVDGKPLPIHQNLKRTELSFPELGLCDQYHSPIYYATVKKSRNITKYHNHGVTRGSWTGFVRVESRVSHHHAICVYHASAWLIGAYKNSTWMTSRRVRSDRISVMVDCGIYSFVRVKLHILQCNLYSVNFTNRWF